MLIKADMRVKSAIEPGMVTAWLGRRKVVVSILILVLGLGGAFWSLKQSYYEGYANELKYILLQMKFEDVTSNYLFVPNYVKALFKSPERIHIDIKHVNYEKLAHFRNVALERNQVTDDLKQYVPAKIRYKNNVYDAKIRLKGDWLDNVLGDKWSLRVRIKQKEALFGMRRFSLQHPRTRNFIYEWLYLKALKDEGIMAVRYDFIDVTLNGKDLGVFALEEHFDKVLIENNRQREGIILRFNSDYRFRPLATDAGRGDWDKHAGLNEQYASNIEVYDEDRVLQDPTLRQQFESAHQLLHALRTKRLPTHRVFDVRKLARYFAIADLMGAQQAPADWSDIRFYYNPITGLIEPIGVEGHVKGPINSLLGSQRSIGESGFKLHDIIFSDDVFYRHYVEHLEEVSQEAYLDRFLDNNKDALKDKLSTIFREWPYRIFNASWLRENQETIRGFLTPTVGMHGYWTGQSQGRLWLDLANIQYMPVEVTGISIGEQPIIAPDDKIILSPRKQDHPPEFVRRGFPLPAGAGWNQGDMAALKVHYKILGASEPRHQTVFPWPVETQPVPNSNSYDRTLGSTDQFDFLVVNEDQRTISIPPGSWTVTKALVIPEGYSFVIEAGANITLKGSGRLVSYSPLEWRGSSDRPIVIEAAPEGGGGVTVLQAAGVSRVSHVVFKNLHAWDDKERSLSGAVSFFEAPVEIHDSQFIGSRAEDALNIVRARFELINVLFDKSESDAFDADFTTGRIVRTSFLDSGNDAIDVSGSRVTIDGLVIRRVSDKALSVGENSEVLVDNLDIEGAELAITSKDLSKIRITDGVIRNSRVGLLAYKKKPEFGPGSIVAKRLKLENVEVEYLVEPGSKVEVNGDSISPNQESLKSILYGAQYGKSSDP